MFDKNKIEKLREKKKKKPLFATIEAVECLNFYKKLSYSK